LNLRVDLRELLVWLLTFDGLIEGEMLEVDEAGLFGVWDGFRVEGGLLDVCSEKFLMLVSICLSTLFVLLLEHYYLFQ
jgi:hypothetical protein